MNLECPNCHTNLELALLPAPDVSTRDSKAALKAAEDKPLKPYEDESPTKFSPEKFLERFPVFQASNDLYNGIYLEERPNSALILDRGGVPDTDKMDVLALEGYSRLHRFRLKGTVVVLSAKDLVETILDSGIAPNTIVSGAYISLAQPSLGLHDHKLGFDGAWNAPLRRTVIDALKLRYPKHGWNTVTTGDAKRIVERLELDHIGSAKQTGTKGIKWYTHSVPQDLDILLRTARTAPETFKYWININLPLFEINRHTVYSRISGSFESEFSDLFTNET